MESHLWLRSAMSFTFDPALKLQSLMGPVSMVEASVFAAGAVVEALQPSVLWTCGYLKESADSLVAALEVTPAGERDDVLRELRVGNMASTVRGLAIHLWGAAELLPVGPDGE